MLFPDLSNRPISKAEAVFLKSLLAFLPSTAGKKPNEALSSLNDQQVINVPNPIPAPLVTMTTSDPAMMSLIQALVDAGGLTQEKADSVTKRPDPSWPQYVSVGSIAVTIFGGALELADVEFALSL